MALSRIISEINEILVKNRDFVRPLALHAPVSGYPSEYYHQVWYIKTRMMWLPNGVKRLRIGLCLAVAAQYGV